MNFNTRNNVRTDDVDGAQVMQYHKFYHNKEEYMGPKDPPKKTIAELRKYKTNPADPSYMVASDNVLFKNIMIGEIDGTSPQKVRYERRENYEDEEY